MNPNLFVWTSDWHLVSNNSEGGIAGDPTTPTNAAAVAAYITSLAPAGVIDTGDCKDHYGSSTGDELDNYVTYVRSGIPWATVNSGVNALYPILPGNHDEVDDSGAGSTDFSLFNARFWSAPYHWTVDWDAPRIRFIAIHAYIQHTGGLQGFFNCDQTEIDWLSSELAALPDDWQAIVCSHPPANPAFGAEIRSTLGGTNLRAVLAANSSRIACYLNGHRHSNMDTNVLSGITHFNGAGVAYTLGGNPYGGFMPITYDRNNRTLTFDYVYATGASAFTRYSGFTPVVITLPALPDEATYHGTASASYGGTATITYGGTAVFSFSGSGTASFSGTATFTYRN